MKLLKLCLQESFLLKGSIIVFLSLIVAVNAQAQFENNPLSEAIDNTAYDVINSFPGWFATTASFTKGKDAAISSIIADDDIAIMSIAYLDTIGRGGRISFDWKMTNTSLFDELFFIMSSVSGTILQRESITSENDWESFSVDIPSSDVILSWAFYEDGAIESVTLGNENGRGWVDNVIITQFGSSLPPECRTFTSNLNSALDNNEYQITGPDFTCQVDDFTTGGSAAQSNVEALRYVTNDMDANVTGPVDLIFDWKIDAGPEDLFKLEIDNEVIDILSGSTQWATRRMSVPEGEHQIRWRYHRFSPTITNSNSGFVDHLRTAEFTNIREGEIIIAPIVDLLLDD